MLENDLKGKLEYNKKYLKKKKKGSHIVKKRNDLFIQIQSLFSKGIYE